MASQQNLAAKKSTKERDSSYYRIVRLRVGMKRERERVCITRTKDHYREFLAANLIWKFFSATMEGSVWREYFFQQQRQSNSGNSNTNEFWIGRMGYYRVPEFIMHFIGNGFYRTPYVGSMNHYFQIFFAECVIINPFCWKIRSGALYFAAVKKERRIVAPDYFVLKRIYFSK